MSDLPTHPVHEELLKENGVQLFDVCIVGSGPIGATYARLLNQAGYHICVLELGDMHDGQHPAAHLKNQVHYQKDIDAFVRVIQGAISPVSVPQSSMVIPEMDPAAWRPPPPVQGSDIDQSQIMHGRNPKQQIQNNLGAEGVTRCVGGMATHWTCATPEFLTGVERPEIFADGDTDDREWKKLYDAARLLIGTSSAQFDQSIRHQTVLTALQNSDRFKNRDVKPLPLACHRLPNQSPYVRWHSAENVYGEKLFQKPPAPGHGFFRLLPNTACARLLTNDVTNEVEIAEVRDVVQTMENGAPCIAAIKAKVFVVAAGAVATPQLLAASGFGGMRDQQSPRCPNIGVRITEQALAFCQIVLRQDLVDQVCDSGHPQWWTDRVAAHKAQFPNDPIPIPVQDPEPQVNIPVQENFPWHAQIHRDAFSYGDTGPRIDPRLVVDLRFFSMEDGCSTNRMFFEPNMFDRYLLPQATFEYIPSVKRAQEASDMMADMTAAAHILGGYLPGSNPQFMTPGLALHLGGTTRVGLAADEDKTVADFNSRVWGFKTLFVAGNGLIPTPFASNPTLTSMCLAIRSAYTIKELLEGRTVDDIRETPEEWLNWTNKKDGNYPKHRVLYKIDIGEE
ncbi:putative pyranose oxidase [Auriculariales sp. MPI-PUGE-AT-0066]|nr:putative pyranose oxidase [Auriculariales sp. MPI-PUGE-AT-0066]